MAPPLQKKQKTCEDCDPAVDASSSFDTPAGDASSSCDPPTPFDLRKFLYERSRKPDSEISDEEVLEISEKMGNRSGNQFSELSVVAMRMILNNWRDRGELLKLPREEFDKIQFITAEEELELVEKAEREWKLSETQRNQSGKADYFCEVCMEKGDHVASMCPYWEFIPRPDEVRVGEKYAIACWCCDRTDHDHPKGQWTGYAIKKVPDQQPQLDLLGDSDDDDDDDEA